MSSIPPHGHTPLVDAQVLRDLEEELGNPTVARSFARDFTEVWEERHRKLADAVARGDVAASHDAVLSVKITSLMVGAARLAQLAVKLEKALCLGHLKDAPGVVAEIQDCGARTVRELRVTYIDGTR